LVGWIDEVRISGSVARSSAWVGASYETQRDNLLTYGATETYPSATIGRHFKPKPHLTPHDYIRTHPQLFLNLIELLRLKTGITGIDYITELTSAN